MADHLWQTTSGAWWVLQLRAVHVSRGHQFILFKNLANIHFLKAQRNSELLVDFSWKKKTSPKTPSFVPKVCFVLLPYPRTAASQVSHASKDKQQVVARILFLKDKKGYLTHHRHSPNSLIRLARVSSTPEAFKGRNCNSNLTLALKKLQEIRLWNRNTSQDWLHVDFDKHAIVEAIIIKQLFIEQLESIHTVDKIFLLWLKHFANWQLTALSNEF